MGKVSGRPGHDPGEGGAPLKHIDLDVLRRAASIGCTVNEIAALLGIAPSTFYLHVHRNPEVAETLEEAREMGRSTLRRFQWQRAANGSDTMLIWLGKNMLHQTDRVETTNHGPAIAFQANVNVTMNVAELSQSYLQLISGDE